MKRENEGNQSQQINMEDLDQEYPNQNTDNQDQESNENNSNNQNQDSGPINPPKRQRRSDDEEVRLLIPSKMAGAIIGKGGHNIQKLRTEYKVQVNVGDCQGPERVITIASNLDTCCTVIREIMKHFDKGNADECELRVLIHQSLAGCVIGKSGAKIKELKDRIGCRLKIFSNIAPQSTDRIAQIVGREDQCIDCLTEIMDLIKSTPIKGPVHNYDPHNFDDLYADEYGGYGSGMSSNFRDGNGRFERGGRLNDRGRFNNDRRGGGNRGNGNNTMRDYVDPWAVNMNGNNQMGGMNNFGNGNMGSTSGNNSNFGNNVDMDGKSSTQVTIPKDLAGAIIGKGGGRIRRIRSESNAFIQIDEALPGSTDRIITITGTSKQIQAAQYMLQQSVRENMR
ncbi:heterogeneous nuclear ribonucleoprotein K-like isoform X2 [Chironomus tepperi]|uniref:heterogeneous nuclear ribonucleoprotein K-like isoform X2 n=1 Tax=Chironomus tepperi TaxID=113505 RepID=UPI00391F6E59